MIELALWFIFGSIVGWWLVDAARKIKIGHKHLWVFELEQDLPSIYDESKMVRYTVWRCACGRPKLDVNYAPVDKRASRG